MADLNNTQPQFGAPDEDDLQTKLKKNQQAAAALATSGDPSAPPSLKSSAAYLQDLQKLADSAEYSRGAPPEAKASLQTAIAEAKKKYEDKASKNDWLELAQIVGRAAVQFAGATRGGRQTNMAGLDLGPTVDYGARTQQAYRESQGDVSNAKDLADAERQSYGDTAAQKREQYERQAEVAKAGLGAAKESEREKLEGRRINATEKRLDTKDDKEQRRLEFQDLSKQEQEAAKQLNAARSLGSQLQTEGDLDKKSRDKLSAKYGSLAAQAGIDIDQLATIGEQSQDKGVFGTGYFKGEDKAKKAQLINEQVVAPIKNMLDSIRARKQQLLGSGTRMAAPADKAATPPPAPGKDPKIADYAKQYTGGDYEKAKGILVKRGYSPAE